MRGGDLIWQRLGRLLLDLELHPRPIVLFSFSGEGQRPSSSAVRVPAKRASVGVVLCVIR